MAAAVTMSGRGRSRSPDGGCGRLPVADTHPADTERLHEYWVHGEGAAKIRWGEPGDFDRCVRHLGKYIGDPQGYCNLAHHAALGIYPATHAKEIKGRSGMANPKPYGDVKYADPKNGKYPIDTAEHAKAAWSYIHQQRNRDQYPLNGVTVDEVEARIKAACAHFGIDTEGDSDSGSSRGAELLAGPYFRSFPLEDISIRAGGDGRTVEAYAAVFNTQAPVHDQDGDYLEELDPSVFNRAISDSRPQGGRKSWKVGLFYNHGMTIWGTPSERHSVPIGVLEDIQADSHGVRTVARYHRTDLADEVLEGIREGSIPGYSFTGVFRRSTPSRPRGGFRPDRAGGLPVVRRLESTLKELGPTPFPVYADAAVTGVRSAMLADPELMTRMLSMLRDGAPADSPSPSGAPIQGLATGDSHSVRSGRTPREQIVLNRSRFLQQHRS